MTSKKAKRFPVSLVFEDGRALDALIPFGENGAVPDVVEAGGANTKRRFKKTAKRSATGAIVYRELKGKVK